MDCNIQIEKREIRHARINVDESGIVKFFVPNEFTTNDVELLEKKKQAWIQKQKDNFQSIKKNIIKLNKHEILLHGEKYNIKEETKLVNVEDIENSKIVKKELVNYSKNYLKELLDELSQKHNLSYNKLFVRDQKTKWGNCSTKKNISLNWRLIMMPDKVKEYIIIHELIHTKILKHNQAFWLYLANIMPDYLNSVDWIKRHENVILYKY
jgi:hypothetical protein